MQVAQDRAAQKTQLKDPLPSASLLPPLLKENNFFFLCVCCKLFITTLLKMTIVRLSYTYSIRGDLGLVLKAAATGLNS